MGMDIEVSQQEDGGYLRVEVTGQLSLSEANAAFARVLESVVIYKSRLVLVDCLQLKGTLSTLERFSHSEFAAESFRSFGKRGILPGLRFAYVSKPPVADENKFGEVVAVNRGIIIKVFDHTDDAINWLKND